MIRNSTIITKKKQLSCGHYDYAFSKGRCKSCATVQGANKRIAEFKQEEERVLYPFMKKRSGGTDEYPQYCYIMKVADLVHEVPEG